MSMPAVPHNGNSSKPLVMFGTDGNGTLTSPSNQLVSRLMLNISFDGRNDKFLTCGLMAIPFWQWDDKDLELKAEMDRFVDDGSLDDNVESFLSHDDADPRDAVGRCMDISKGRAKAIF